MNFCYLILAQRFPKQLAKLVEAIYSNDSFIYIHLDAEVDLKEFRKELVERPNVFFTQDRIKCIWGHRTMIDAALLLLNASKGLAKYYVLLSDQHYPVRSKQSLWDYLTNNQLEGIIEFNYPEPIESLQKRIDYVTLFYGKQRKEYIRIPPVKSRAFWAISTLKRVVEALIRGQILNLNLLWKFPELPIEVKWGSQWWILSNFTVEKILVWLEENPEFYEAVEHRLIVDEFFFQSIIDHLNLNIPILYKSATFVRRSVDPPFEFPQLFKAKDIDLLTDLPDHIFFARKFDVQSDPEIINMLSLRLNSK